MKRLLMVLALASLPALAQTKISPDCDIQFSLTAAGSSSITGCAQNLQGVRNWTMTYQSIGFSGLTLTVQEAPDAGGTPGSWSTFTAASGTNPATSTTGVGADTTYTGYAPWVRVTLSGLTGSGTVTGHLYGCRNPGCGASASSGGGGAPGGSVNDIQWKLNATTFGGGRCTMDSSQNIVCAGSFTSGSGSGATGAVDLVGKTSGATSTITVDDNNTATNLKLPNDATAGLYIPSSPTATPSAGCAQYSGTSTEITSTATPCGSGGGGGTPGSTYFTYVNSTGTGPNDTASETSLIGTATTGSKTIPANTFTAGALTELRVDGQITTPVSPDNLTLNIYMGATKIATGTVTGSNLNSLTTQTFKLSLTMGTLTGGASCSMVIEDISIISGAVLAGDIAKLQGTGTTFDCTASQAFDVKAQWGAAQVGESLLGMVVGLYTPGAGPTLSAHHQYIQAAAYTGTGQTVVGFQDIVATNLLGSNPVAIVTFSSGNSGIIIFHIPSTWDGSAITFLLDAMTSTNGTGNYSFTPAYECITSSIDLSAAPSYTTGSTVTQAASGLAGFRIAQVPLTLVPAAGCTAGNSVQVKITRGSSDTYSASMFALGGDLVITY